jgi:4-aminobutyrate aminotransferase-like enzyme
LAPHCQDEHQILTSIDGPHDNVLVLKPPMCFNKEDAEKLISCMKKVLTTMGPIDAATYKHTPT